MKRSAAFAILIGLGVGITLYVSNDLTSIFDLLLNTGWGILLVVCLHIPQTLFSVFGWRVLIGDGRPPRLWLLYRLRWIRESANALLPMAQIGGDLVRSRLLAQEGVRLTTAVASSMVDLSVEMAAQIIFTVFSMGLLLMGAHNSGAFPIAVGTTAASCLIGIAFMAAQRFGMFKLVERAIARSAAGAKWAFLGDLTGLNETVVALYRHPRRLLASGAYHLISWALGALETYAAMRVLGIDGSLREAAILEGLGQAVRGLAFFVPGALGVQEGGYLLICGMFGISPQKALALSLIRRIRELALGVPGLILWHRLEGRLIARAAAAEMATQ